MDDRTFRTAMGKFATGVTVITTMLDDEVKGMTANAFMSVSLDPALVLISVGENAHMNKYVKESGKFAISILNSEQQEMSAYFAGQKKENRNIDFNWFNGMPTIKDSLVNLTCNVHNTVIAGDHTLYIGEVTDVCITDGEPLAFFAGKYNDVNKCEKVK
ncbi:flavin reductase [Virgibacillus phasianinus]|uniref:Flavin reductase n=1 Tax=Virgibacillus phasianinus TaxID=2017483 RepID=A0A220U3J9_9BACI|nr:flavin reductase family protein [Virgibacillus phasianinus]ASK62625.1 flavin reductase [Virgibacillus phasianinus]